MNVGDLREVLESLPDDMPIHSIFNGTIDESPSYNVVDDILYIEGAGEWEEPGFGKSGISRT